MPTNRRRPAFTLIELLVVIAIIALLMSILMPALSRVRKQARTSACMARLRQWGLFFSMFAEDNNGYFQEGLGGMPDGSSNRWVMALGPYHKWDDKFLCCPNATKECYDEAGNNLMREGTWAGSTAAWGYYKLSEGWPKPTKGSYGINGYSNNPRANSGATPHSRDKEWFWRKPGTQGASYAPLLLAALRYNGWPLETDTPPANDGDVWNDNAQMGRYCMNRHDGFVNALFIDFSVHKVGLKELWTLKWHKAYKTDGAWTKAGGVAPTDWPDWLRRFKDY